VVSLDDALTGLPDCFHEVHGYGHTGAAHITSGGSTVVEVTFSDCITRTIVVDFLTGIDHEGKPRIRKTAEHPDTCELSGTDRKTCGCLACRLRGLRLGAL